MRLTVKEVSVVREYRLPRFKTNFLPHPIINIILLIYIALFPSLKSFSIKNKNTRPNTRNYTILLIQIFVYFSLRIMHLISIE